MRPLMQWLFGRPPARIGLRPHRVVDVGLPPDIAFDRVVEAIDVVLGGYVRASDRARGEIDADFGTVGSERLRATLIALDDAHTRIEVEARYPVTAQPAASSQYVDALAEYLGSPRAL